MKKEYLNNLELYRIFLCISVFMYHAYYNMSCDFGQLNNFIVSAVYYMTAFFMLSGLVVCFSNNDLCCSKWEDVTVFYKKRLWSLFPLYLLVFVFAILINVRSIHDLFLVCVSLPYQLLGMANIVQNEYFMNSGTWFFTNIFLCYLLYPYINFILNRLALKKLKGVTVILLVLVIDAKLIELYMLGTGIYRNPIIRIMEFSAGLCIAKLYRYSARNIKRGIWCILLGIVNLFAIYITGNTANQAMISAPLIFIMLWVLIKTDSKWVGYINKNWIVKKVNKCALEIWVATFFTTEIVNRIVFRLYLPIKQENLYKICCCCFINIIVVILLRIYQRVILKLNEKILCKYKIKHQTHK